MDTVCGPFEAVFTGIKKGKQRRHGIFTKLSKAACVLMFFILLAFSFLFVCYKHSLFPFLGGVWPSRKTSQYNFGLHTHTHTRESTATALLLLGPHLLLQLAYPLAPLLQKDLRLPRSLFLRDAGRK
jgi:hypothetical protein